MFTAKEKKNLAKLLAIAADPDDALNLEELHGFLFGLAIIPELIKPSEWLPVVFGEEMIEVESEAEAGEQLGHLFSVYNRLNAENQAGALAFPFAFDALKTGDLSRIGDWTYGLYLAITLRPRVWGFDSQTDWSKASITDDIQEISTSIGIIMSIAKPELIPEIFERTAFDPEASESDARLQATLFALLPAAVATVQEHAGKLNKERSAIKGLPAAPRRRGSGRNDPCPCGSGKKYKRCCGMN